jgi:hypothetical protein
MAEVSEEVELTSAEADRAGRANALLQMITSFWVSQTVRAVAELSLADHVAVEALTAEQIAEREASDPATTYRLLRAAASLGLFTADGDRRFSVTPLGSLLCKGVPGSLRDMARVQGMSLQWQSWGTLPEAVREGRTQMHAALGVPADNDMFDYLADHPEEGALFAASMSDATGMVIDDVVSAVDLGGISVAVDVGGAYGALVLAMMHASPDLTGIVLDRPGVVDGAIRQAAEAGLAARFTGVAGDFFKEVPPADLYLLKMILHDWDDDACVAILRNCRVSARPGARAVVVESVIGPIGEPSFAALLDINMLASTSGQERDYAEFDALYAAAGWRRIAATQTRTPQAIQELRAI